LIEQTELLRKNKESVLLKKYLENLLDLTFMVTKLLSLRYLQNVDQTEEAARNVSMQAAAMNQFSKRSWSCASIIEKKLKCKDQLRQEGKPEAMLDNTSRKDSTFLQRQYFGKPRLY
jgi:elongation factor Ts